MAVFPYLVIYMFCALSHVSSVLVFEPPQSRASKASRNGGARRDRTVDLLHAMPESEAQTIEFNEFLISEVFLGDQKKSIKSVGVHSMRANYVPTLPRRRYFDNWPILGILIKAVKKIKKM